MDNLAALYARKVQQRADEERSIPLQKDSESQSKRQSRPNELSENCWKRAFLGQKKGDS